MAYAGDKGIHLQSDDGNSFIHFSTMLQTITEAARMDEREKNCSLRKKQAFDTVAISNLHEHIETHIVYDVNSLRPFGVFLPKPMYFNILCDGFLSSLSLNSIVYNSQLKGFFHVHFELKTDTLRHTKVPHKKLHSPRKNRIEKIYPAVENYNFQFKAELRILLLKHCEWLL